MGCAGPNRAAEHDTKHSEPVRVQQQQVPVCATLPAVMSEIHTSHPRLWVSKIMISAAQFECADRVQCRCCAV